MTAPKHHALSPETIQRFYEYYRANPSWGSLHIALEDFNLDNYSILDCIEHARKQEDTEGEALAELLLNMSKSQRLKLAKGRYT